MSEGQHTSILSPSATLNAFIASTSQAFSDIAGQAFDTAMQTAENQLILQKEIERQIQGQLDNWNSLLSEKMTGNLSEGGAALNDKLRATTPGTIAEYQAKISEAWVDGGRATDVMANIRSMMPNLGDVLRGAAALGRFGTALDILRAADYALAGDVSSSAQVTVGMVAQSVAAAAAGTALYTALAAAGITGVGLVLLPAIAAGAAAAGVGFAVEAIWDELFNQSTLTWEQLSEAFEFIDLLDQKLLQHLLVLDPTGLFRMIREQVHALFENAQTWDPLALDLDGDGIETVGIGDWQTTTLFDHDGDGVRDGTGWLSGDDGWLVRDLNGNGTIDTGAELFGDNTLLSDGSKAADGFSALSELDNNADGIIDASDSAFGELKVWQDRNQDGISQADELTSLTDLGIASIDLASTTSNETQNGNTVSATSSFTRSDGTTGTLGNLDLARSTFFTEFTDANVGDTALPDIHGSGAVRNLRDAASRSAALTSVLTQYSAANRDGQLALLDTLISTWAASSGMQSMVERADEDKVIVLYQFGDIPSLSDEEVVDALLVMDGNGGSSSGGNGSNGGGIREFIMDAMASESRAEYQKWFDIISVLERFNGEEFVSFDRPARPQDITIIDTGHSTAGGGQAVGVGYDFIRIHIQSHRLELLEQPYNALRDSVYDNLVVQTRLRPYLDSIGLTTRHGQIVLDFAELSATFDARFASNDIDAAWDLIDMDKMLGAQLNGQGWAPFGYLATQVNAAALDLSADAVAVLAAAGISIGDSDGGESLQATTAIKHLIGRNGADTLTGTHGANQLFGAAGDDVLIGHAGDDHLYGEAGNDVLDGGNGTNYLDGGAGNDSLTTNNYSSGTEFRGGTGDDTLNGSLRDDTYYYRLGDGRDVIDERGSYTGVVDKLVLEGLTPADVHLVREGNSLLFNIADGGQIKVQDWYRDDKNRVEEVRFADGTVWDVAHMHQAGLAVRGTAGDDTLVGLDNQVDLLYGEAGDDVLQGKGGNDQLYGGDGNDTLNGGYGLGETDYLDGGAGDDTLKAGSRGTRLRGGTGDDRISGSSRDDTYYYRLGDGRDVITERGGYGGDGDKLVFEDLNPADVQIAREGASLILNISDGGQVKIWDWYRDTQGAYRIEQVSFADGTVWDAEAMHQAGLEVQGTSGDDTLLGLNDQDDRLYGGAGNDVLDGGTGADYLDGGAGNDSLTTNNYSSGNEFRGGAGNDTLNGSLRDDIYYYRLGDGCDVIDERGSYTGVIDKLVLEDLNPADVQLAREGASLVLNVSDGGQIKVQDWYRDDKNRVEEVRFADGTVWDVAHMHQAGLVVQGTAGDDTLVGLDNQVDLLYGEAGDDVLQGKGGNDQLYGGDGNDTLNGGSGGGADYLDGGAGDDTLKAGTRSTRLRGGMGDDQLTGNGRGDTYYYRLGDGRDVIKDYGSVSYTDKLVFEDLNPADVQIAREGASLVLNVADGGQVKIQDWYRFTNGAYHVEQVLFADGTVWDAEAMHQAGLEVQGTSGDDTLLGLNDQDDRLYGGAGNDVLDGGTGADYLDGGAGDDSLTTNNYSSGNEFRGGTGNDTLNGSLQEDTYYYRLGDGRDVIDERGSYTGVIDKLVLEELNHDQLWFERTGDDLVMSVIGTDDQVAIDDWYRDTKNQVELFEASDAMALSNNNIDQLVNAMAAFNKPAAGETELSTQLRDDLSPVLAASWQSAS